MSYGFFNGGSYTPKTCASIELAPEGNVVVPKFPKNSILYCKDKLSFYKIDDSNNPQPISTKSQNIYNWVPSWNENYATMTTNAVDACEFDFSTGVRRGNCNLPSEIIYMRSCGSISTVTFPNALTAATVFAADTQIDGQYYKSVSGSSITVYQYSSSTNSLRPILKPDGIDSAWAKFLMSIPKLLDSSKYTGSSTTTLTASNVVLGGVKTLKSSDVTKLFICKNDFSKCPKNGIALLSAYDCHTPRRFFSSISPTGTLSALSGLTIRTLCLQQLYLTCSTDASHVDFCPHPINGDRGFDMCKTQADSKDTRENCGRFFDAVFVGSNYENLYQSCSTWLPYNKPADCVTETKTLLGLTSLNTLSLSKTFSTDTYTEHDRIKIMQTFMTNFMDVLYTDYAINGCLENGIKTWKLYTKSPKGIEITRSFQSLMFTKLIDSNYPKKAKYVAVDCSAAPNTTPGSGLVGAAIGYCNGNSDNIYYFTNSIGGTTIWNSLNSRKVLLFRKSATTGNAPTAILNSYGLFNTNLDTTDWNRECSIDSGYRFDSGLPQIQHFPINSFIYCASTTVSARKFYRIVGNSNARVQITDSTKNMQDWIPNWTTLADMLVKANNGDCEWDNTKFVPTRKGTSCNLPDEIQYIPNCSALTFPPTKRDLHDKRQSSLIAYDTALVDAKYYGCENELAIPQNANQPRNVYQYVESDNSLRQVVAAPDDSAAWAELIEKMPNIANCVGYEGYGVPSKRKRLLNPVFGGNNNLVTPRAVSNLGLYCSSSCSTDLAKKFIPSSCHTTAGLFTNTFKVGSTAVNEGCVQELALSCANLLDANSLYCPGMTFPCTQESSVMFKSNCRSYYDRVYIGSNFERLYKSCAFWKTTFDVASCNNEATKLRVNTLSTGRISADTDAANILYSFLLDDQLAPPPAPATN